MLIVFIRAILIYVFLLVTMRLMGKKQLGELQPFEFAVTLVVAELACIPMSDVSVPMSYGIVPILTLLVLEFIITKIVKHSIRLRKIINGKPIIVINKKGIDYHAISNLDMTVNDLLEALRGCNILSPAEVEFAIMETNGKLSVVQKSKFRPLLLKDCNCVAPPPLLPYCVICEGKLLMDNIIKLSIEKDNVLDILKTFSLKQKDILLMTVKSNLDYYIQPINKQFLVGSLEGII